MMQEKARGREERMDPTPKRKLGVHEEGDWVDPPKKEEHEEVQGIGDTGPPRPCSSESEEEEEAKELFF